ncbi:MAG: efflux RND transporter periplasmic adaptor subunit [Verrucomicrobia bacterium]|nr:efflux RND transporter periplasmic adaptor subunit [Verrucomicrobiota bacterium]
MAAKTKSRRKLWLVLILLLLAGGGGVWFQFFRKKEVIVAVQTEKVLRRDIMEKVVATGKIQPVVQVAISPEVSGEIIELPVKEGQSVKKGDLLLKIKPDFYVANQRSAEANLKSSQASGALAAANLEKATAEFKRAQELMGNKLISESQFQDAKTGLEVVQAQVQQARHQADVAKASLDRANEELSKTTIYAPVSATISKLKSQLGERVVGTATMAGTEVMTLSDLNEMEARVDLSETDVVLIAAGQRAQLEVDAFRDKKFTGTVSEIANSARLAGGAQDATKFEVRIRIHEKEAFRPGMSVTAEIETRQRTNVLAVPLQSVTTRMPKTAEGNSADNPNAKKNEANKPVEVVFLAVGEQAKMAAVKRGINDDNYVEILDGLKEGQSVVSGNYRAINRDLEDGIKIKSGGATNSPAKP